MLKVQMSTMQNTKKAIPLAGKVIGNYRPERMDAMETMKRAFDGNVLSSPKTVKTQTDAWAGNCA